MTIELWDWLEHVDYLVGASFPQADEDALRRCGQAWARTATGLRALVPDAATAGGAVLAALDGQTGGAFGSAWDQITGPDGYLPGLAALCEQLAAACDGTAQDIEYAKLEYVGALVALGATLAVLAGAIWAGGVSALGMPAAISAAQFTIRLLLTRLVTGILVGVVFTTGLDAAAQLVQLADGHRDHWDWSKTAAAAGDGAIYGALGGVAFAGAGRLAAMGRGPGLLGLVAAGMGTGAAGGLVVPLSHGDAPSGAGFLLSTTAGLVGGLASSHGRAEPTADLSALTVLDPAAGRRLGGGLELDALTDRSLDAGAELAGSVLASGTVADGLTAGVDGRPTVLDGFPGDHAIPAGDARDLAGVGVTRPGPVDHVPLVPAGDVSAGAGRGSQPARSDRPGDGAGDVASAPAGAVAAPRPSAAEAPGGSGPAPADGRRATSSVAGTPAAPGDSATAPLVAGATGPAAGPAAGREPGPAGRADLHPSTVVDGHPPVPLGDGAAGASGAGPHDWPRPRSRGTADLEQLKDEAVARLVERAAAVEPRLTELAADVADRAGGRLAGLDQVRKTDASLRERLDRFRPPDRPDYPRYAALRLAGIRDSVRYTILFPEERYRIGAQAAIDDLLERGLRPVAQVRSWDRESGYLGVNTTWFDPSTAHIFEVQLHTAATFEAKSIAHPVYKRLGGAELTGAERVALRGAQLRIFADVRVPDGAVEVGIPDTVPRHRPDRDAALDRSGPRSGPLWTPEMGSVDFRHPVSDGEAVALVRDNAVPTPAGLAFYAADDNTRYYAAAVRPVAGYLTLDLHGSRSGFLIGSGVLTPQQFGLALRGLRDRGLLMVPDGLALKLIACDTAFGGEASPAAIVARTFGVEVVAPDQPVWTAFDGDELVSSPRLANGNVVPTIPPDGRWHRFDRTGRERPLGPAPAVRRPGDVSAP
jgi:hypothetical protein